MGLVQIREISEKDCIDAIVAVSAVLLYPWLIRILSSVEGVIVRSRCGIY